MRTLFISFTSLLYSMKRGEISQDQLDNGLFVFGCSREYALDPFCYNEESVAQVFTNAEGVYDQTRARQVVEQIHDALLAAERDGRAYLRHREESFSYGMLSDVLERNGYARLPTQFGDGTGDDDGQIVLHSGVIARMKAVGNDMNIVPNR